MKQRTLSILVDNTAGVLSRVAGLFSRRDYNIDSLTVGVTADNRYSRITVVATGDDQVLEQITKQVSKLVDVEAVKVLEPENSVQRELIMIKVRCNASQRQDIVSLASIFRASIIDVSKESIIIEATGAKGKLEALKDLLSGFEILEVARTGVTGLSRGIGDVTYL
ncbi:MAG: acetolactate synthase small subunit [Candidatus Alectryocaccobium sp.]|jgi:acetolactate synthase-1/3 small subunit|nr:acetolactate synthase small subunit [Lachnospiraceae bacterium]MDY6220935.1 acetolactate synthase small subunit [Candidatus Alectryocaccobium sp.]